MPFSVRPLHPTFVAEVTGIDLRRPLDTDTAVALTAAIDQAGILVFPGQLIEDAALAALGGAFGNLYHTGTAFREDRIVIRLGNLDDAGNIRPADDAYRARNAANEFWHIDNTFSEPPAKYSLLLARVVPPDGGETEFADARSAYDALPAETKERIGPLSCSHSFLYSRSLTGITEWSEAERRGLPSRVRPLVVSNPRTGRKALYVTSHIEGVIGLADEAGQTLIRELTELATQPHLVYRHTWKPGDLVMYDNQAVLHRARPYADLDHPRDMRAIRVMAAA